MHGRIVWNELNTRAPEAAKAFYGTVIGWTFTPKEMSDGRTYWLAMADGEPVAGLFTLDAEQHADIPDHWFAYLEVDDVDARAATAIAAGGTLRTGPEDIPGVGRLAVIRDPVGAYLGWMTPRP